MLTSESFVNKNTSNCRSLSLRRQTVTTGCLFNVQCLLSLIFRRPRSIAAPSLPRGEEKRRGRTSENKANVYWVYLVLGFDWLVFVELRFTPNYSSPSRAFDQSGTVGKMFKYLEPLPVNMENPTKGRKFVFSFIASKRPLWWPIFRNMLRPYLFFSFIVECVFWFWVGGSEKEKKKLEKESGARRPGTSA